MTAVHESIPAEPTTASTAAGDGVPPPPPSDPPPRVVDVRDTGVALSLSGVSIEAGRQLLLTIHGKRRTRVEAQIASEVALRRTAEENAAAALAHARENAAKVAEYVRRKSALEERVRQLAHAIRAKRHELEARKIVKELERLDDERHETITRLGRERTLRHEAALSEWASRENERSARVAELKAQRDELAAAERRTREEAAGIMNRWMTRTASGFLVWAGYTVIGATGAAVSFLLADSQRRSLLTDVAASSVQLLDEFRGGVLHPLFLALLSLLGFLASLVAVLIGIDLLMRWFDKRWMKSKPLEQGGFKFPTRVELGRSTFSKLLMTIPLIYIAGSIIAFVAYGGRITTSTRVLMGESTSVLHTIIGSALSLLSTSIFLLYFTNILEPRTRSRGSSWRMVWEIGIVPFTMILAVILVAAFGPESRWAWTGITIFMLLGAMALAYGLSYRGMYAQIDYMARATAHCERMIEETLQPPVIHDPDRFEQREIVRVLSDYRDRRQQLLDLDRERRLRRMLLTTDEHDPSLVASYHVASGILWNVIVRWRRVAPQPDFYRVTDLEAAPVESAERQQLEQQIRDIDLELAVLPAEVTRAHVEKCERDFDNACAEREHAERVQPLRLAMNDEREVTESLEFENAYSLGLSMKPSYDAVTRRRDQNMTTAVKRRVPRPSRVHVEEVPSGH